MMGRCFNVVRSDGCRRFHGMAFTVFLLASAISGGRTPAAPRPEPVLPPPCESSTRQQQWLHGIWSYQGASNAEQAAPATDGWQEVTVPAFTVSPESGHGWFRRRSDIPASWAGSHIQLCADNIMDRVEVTVNGRSLPVRVTAGSVPHLFDVTEAVKPGEANEFLLHIWDRRSLRVDPGKPMTERNLGYPSSPGQAQGRFGIVDNIALQSRPSCYVENVRIRTSVRTSRLSVDVWVRNTTGRAFRGTVSGAIELIGLLNPDIDPRDHSAGALPVPAAVAADVAPDATACVTLEAVWPEPVLWWPDYPFLYRFQTRLVEATDEIDVHPVQFGFREVWRQGPDVYLNGVVMQIRTVFGQDSRTYRDTASYRDHIRYIQRWQYNLYRAHTHPWPARVYRAADELGMGMVLESAASFGSG